MCILCVAWCVLLMCLYLEVRMRNRSWKACFHIQLDWEGVTTQCFRAMVLVVWLQADARGPQLLKTLTCPRTRPFSCDVYQQPHVAQYHIVLTDLEEHYIYNHLKATSLLWWYVDDITGLSSLKHSDSGYYYCARLDDCFPYTTPHIDKKPASPRHYRT